MEESKHEINSKDLKKKKKNILDAFWVFTEKKYHRWVSEDAYTIVRFGLRIFFGA